MFNKYYLQELQNLRELAAEFSRTHPAIAPLLSGPSSDPDVERLLEGVSFLTGLLHQKLNDDYPEIVQGLMNIIFPHYLRPIPATSIVVFTPKPNLPETVQVKKGTSLASVPVEGSACLFQTCFDLEVHPLRLTAAALLQAAGQPTSLQLTLELSGPNLSQWNPSRLAFFLGGSSNDAADLFMILTRYLRRILLTPAEGGKPAVLAPAALKPVGFDLEKNLLPLPSRSFAGYRLLQEYFILPRKFFFLELTGWEQWTERGNGRRFQVQMELLPSPVPPPKITPDHFILYGAPVINLFPHQADPIALDHRMERYRVLPAAPKKGAFRVYSVDRVVGHVQGSVTRKDYVPLERFQYGESAQPTYQVSYGRSPIDNSAEVYLSFTYPPGSDEPEREVLSVDLTCTNGELPEQLKLGDIRMPTSDSPGLLTFANVVPPTAMIEPPLGENVPWRFLSHLGLNYLNLADEQNLKELLRLYVFPEGRDRAAIAANLKRIEGILDFRVSPMDYLLKGRMLRGQVLEMTCRHDHFAGLGGLYLFGAVMDLFFGVYASMNTFVQLRLKDSISGETFSWPARMGDRLLI